MEATYYDLLTQLPQYFRDLASAIERRNSGLPLEQIPGLLKAAELVERKDKYERIFIRRK